MTNLQVIQRLSKAIAGFSLVFMLLLATLSSSVNAQPSPAPTAAPTPNATPANIAPAPNVTPARAATPGQTVAAPAIVPAPTPTPKTPSLENVRVTDAYQLGYEGDKNLDERNSASLQEIVVVAVKDLEKLVRNAKCLTEDDHPVPHCEPQGIGLFLDGRLIKGIVPESGAPILQGTTSGPHNADGTLQFHLQRNADSDETWADLLGSPPLGHDFFKRPTAVSVGLEHGYAVPSDIKVPATNLKHKFQLIRIHKAWFIVCLVLLVIVLVLLFGLAWYSELLRDLGPSPSEDPPNKSWMAYWTERKQRKHKPYSLARFQMAFWFFLMIASFLFIWLITGANDTITTSTLALIGIGAFTALGAAAIDVTKQGNAAEQPVRVSDGFLRDLLADRVNGVSFHRFQMFVWTLVLGVLFVYQVWHRLSMPEFSPTLLAMLGISSGTYLGFKIPEQQN